VTGDEENPSQAEFEALRARLGLARLSPSTLNTVISLAGVKTLTLEVNGLDIPVLIPAEAQQALGQKFKALAREEKRGAADAGNAANTALLVCGSIGGPLGTGGIVAIMTTSGHVTFAAIAVTAIGGFIALVGLIRARVMSKRKFAHEERLERYVEVIEELK